MLLTGAGHGKGPCRKEKDAGKTNELEVNWIPVLVKKHSVCAQQRALMWRNVGDVGERKSSCSSITWVLSTE